MIRMNDYHIETMKLAIERSEDIKRMFMRSVERLLRSGALPENGYSRSDVFKVAAEEIADSFKITNKKLYKNLQHF
jgi:hypothetical protein